MAAPLPLDVRKIIQRRALLTLQAVPPRPGASRPVVNLGVGMPAGMGAVAEAFGAQLREQGLALDQAVKDNGTKFDAGYVYISGFTPMERRDEIWSQVKQANPGIIEKARFGTLNPPIANSVADQASAVLRANPDISVIFAPFDEFAKGAKIAVDEAGLGRKVKIYSADISTADIQIMKEPDSAWAATAMAWFM